MRLGRKLSGNSVAPTLTVTGVAAVVGFGAGAAVVGFGAGAAVVGLGAGAAVDGAGDTGAADGEVLQAKTGAETSNKTTTATIRKLNDNFLTIILASLLFSFLQNELIHTIEGLVH